MECYKVSLILMIVSSHWLPVQNFRGKGLVSAIFYHTFYLEINRQMKSVFRLCPGSLKCPAHWCLNFSTLINSYAVLSTVQNSH